MEIISLGVPVMEKYKTIFEKLIAGLKQIYGNNLQAVVLYGSVARGMPMRRV